MYILDPIHNRIPMGDVKPLIDTPLFQRLINVKQLAFLRHVFQSAQHSRFEHSVGTMHLATRLWECLLENQKKLLEETPLSPPIKETEELYLCLQKNKAYFKKILRMAALLHDVGHFPYSHASEGFLKRNVHIDDLIHEGMPDWMQKGFEGIKKQTKEVSHEILGMKLIGDWFLADPSWLRALGGGTNILRDVLGILDPKFTPHAKSLLTEPVQQLLHQLVSGHLDADRMDYLLRDSYNTGVKYGLFDCERLLSSLCFTISKAGEPILAIKGGGAAALEYYLWCRYHMHLQVYGHKTNIAFEVILQKLLYKLPHAKAYAKQILHKEGMERLHDHTFLEEKAIGKDAMSPELTCLYDALFKGVRNPPKRIFYHCCYGCAEKKDETTGLIKKPCKEEYCEVYSTFKKGYEEECDIFFYDKDHTFQLPDIPILRRTPTRRYREEIRLSCMISKASKAILDRRIVRAIYVLRDRENFYIKALDQAVKKNISKPMIQ